MKPKRVIIGTCEVNENQRVVSVGRSKSLTIKYIVKEFKMLISISH